MPRGYVSIAEHKKLLDKRLQTAQQLYRDCKTILEKEAKNEEDRLTQELATVKAQLQNKIRDNKLDIDDAISDKNTQILKLEEKVKELREVETNLREAYDVARVNEIKYNNENIELRAEISRQNMLLDICSKTLDYVKYYGKDSLEIILKD